MTFDPWPSEPIGRGSSSKKKVARLAGKEPNSGKVHVLIKLHNWSGRSIYVYNLVASEIRQIPKPSDEAWNQYSQLGIEIPHPGKMQATDVTKWVKYGRQEAQKRGLKVQE